MSNPVTPVSAEENSTEGAASRKINFGKAVFFLGIIGFMISFISNYLPAGMSSNGLTFGASVVTLAAVLSYIALFQPLGRKFAFWAMLLFSIASPVLFFIAFMSYM